MDLLLQFGLLALGFVLLGKGADWFVEGAAGIAAKFGIPQLGIGLTIVAMGTSAPEAAVSIAASLKGSADITIGNVVGSNILNILVILGCASVITPLLLARSTARIEIPYVIAITVLLFWQGRDGVISFVDGLTLCVGFVIYLAYLYRMAVNSAPTEEERAEEEMSVGKCVVWTLGGLAVIIVGSNVTVNAATAIAVFMGLSERIIGLTIVALGTSLPELFTSVTAARKGNAEAFTFSKPHIKGYNYSFSGLKTSFLYFLEDKMHENPHFIEENKEDLAASLEKTVVDVLMSKLRMAVKDTGIYRVAVAGGVSANTRLREAFLEQGRTAGWHVYIPPFSYTTDNGAMIAMAGYFKYQDKDFCPMEAPAYSRVTLK